MAVEGKNCRRATDRACCLFPAGEIVTKENSLSASFEMQFDQASAHVSYSGLAPNLVLYQFNVVVPVVSDNNLVQMTFELGGVAGTQTLVTAVQR